MNEIDEYLSRFPQEIREKLEQIRQLVKKLSPDAKETIKYGIPTFILGKNLVHFAGYKNHIGFYPTPSAIKLFSKDIERYRVTKGTIQFPHDKALPLKLIEKMVLFRIHENNLLK